MSKAKHIITIKYNRERCTFSDVRYPAPLLSGIMSHDAYKKYMEYLLKIKRQHQKNWKGSGLECIICHWLLIFSGIFGFIALLTLFIQYRNDDFKIIFLIGFILSLLLTLFVVFTFYVLIKHNRKANKIRHDQFKRVCQVNIHIHYYVSE